MAIIKHKTSKNSRYADVLEYYTYKHYEDERTGRYEPILDENGLMIEREKYAVAYIASDGRERAPELWAVACMKTNLKYQKNLNKGDRKSHEYILSHPAQDRVRLSDEDLMQEGKSFARKFLSGYDVLIAVHRDTDNDHVHITINSVRAQERQREEWMMRDELGQVLSCEVQAGGKHQDSPTLRRSMNDWLRDYTKEHGLEVKDNNAIADTRREQRNKEKNRYMRTAILEVAGRSRNAAELVRGLRETYNIDMKISGTGNTISVLYPGNTKYVRLRTLGLEPAELTRLFVGEEYTFDEKAEREWERVRNELDRIRKHREQLKRRLKKIQESRSKFWEISYNCEQAAKYYDSRGWASEQKWEQMQVYRFKWFQRALWERDVRQQLEELKVMEKKLKAQARLNKKERKRTRAQSGR